MAKHLAKSKQTFQERKMFLKPCQKTTGIFFDTNKFSLKVQEQISVIKKEEFNEQ